MVRISTATDNFRDREKGVWEVHSRWSLWSFSCLPKWNWSLSYLPFTLYIYLLIHLHALVGCPYLFSYVSPFTMLKAHYLPLYSKNLAQFLLHSRHSISSCWKGELSLGKEENRLPSKSERVKIKPWWRMGRWLAKDPYMDWWLKTCDRGERDVLSH